MRTRTRRWLITLTVFAAIVLPAEAIVVTTMRDGHRSVEDIWSRRLDDVSRTAAVKRLGDYPVTYRHALLRSLGDTERRYAWQMVARSFMADQRQLSERHREILDRVIAAQAIGDPENLVLLDTAETVRRELGEAAYRYLFFNAGSPDRGPAYGYSALPIRTRLEAFMRGQVLKADPYNCDCRMGLSLDCTGQGETCQSDTNCRSTASGCGINQGSSCDGMCKSDSR
jgi:hypothetical protein